MKIKNMTQGSDIYTSNAYLITGSWNTLADTNTLVDTGRDISIIEKIKNASTGVGKHKVEQVILTHSHYDHAGMMIKIKQEFNTHVLAFTQSLQGVDKVLFNGQLIKMGDQIFEVIHMPGHSSDSICLYNERERVLFAGDSPLIINTEEGNYDNKFISVFKKLTSLKIDTIYFGHGEPMIGKCNEVLTRSLRHLTNGKNNKNERG